MRIYLINNYTKWVKSTLEWEKEGNAKRFIVMVIEYLVPLSEEKFCCPYQIYFPWPMETSSKLLFYLRQAEY